MNDWPGVEFIRKTGQAEKMIGRMSVSEKRLRFERHDENPRFKCLLYLENFIHERIDNQFKFDDQDIQDKPKVV